MNPEHRKIELQSPADLAFLTAKMRTLARQKLDLHLPPQPDTTEPDELRSQVEDLVDAFVAQVLAGMRHNISINGLDVVKRGAAAEDGDAMHVDAVAGVDDDDGAAEVQDFAPFDEKLRARLGAATQKRDALVSKTSLHRRSTPAAAARGFQDRFAREMAELEAATAEAERVALEEGSAQVVGVDGLQRQEEVERSWERAVEGLGRLNKGLPETRARLERCGHVVGYLGGAKGRA